MDITKWLNEVGLPEYAEAFRSNDVDASILAKLTAADLKEIGVLSVGHRRRLLEAAARLRDNDFGTAPELEAERRHLTIMFVDLVGSTALSRSLDPEDMRHVILRYQRVVAEEITRLEGHVAKFMGDGVLAYFGWPRVHEDEAERAVRAGLAIVAALPMLPDQSGRKLEARVGIATGLVVVGDLVGQGASQEMAVVGDAPNLAARLQAVAEPGTVVISETTRRLLGDLFVLREIRPKSLKGIDAPTRAYAVIVERSLGSRFAAKQTGDLGPLEGRDEELALLLEGWRRAKGGEGQVILLTGEAGIGKSRLSEAMVSSISGESHVLLRYQCSPYHSDTALFPVAQQIAQAAEFQPGEGTDHRLDRLERLLAMGTARVREAAPLVAALMGIDGKDRYGELTYTPQKRRDRTLAVLVDQLRGLAETKPVLWIIEDAHWIDPTTLELVEMTVDVIRQSKVLLLIIARPTFTVTFESHPLVTRLALNRVAHLASQAIMARIAGGKRLPDALMEEIAAKTEGVPLFVEEVTKAVLESGTLREAEDSYYLDSALNAFAVPATLHDSLMTRLDRLRDVKEVAQIGAVIGRSFDHRTVSALAGLTYDQLEIALQKLVDAELIFQRGQPPDATYLFKHALVRDAAYESLLKAKRVALHARLLDLLDLGEDVPPEIKAQHAEAAGQVDRAVTSWEEAGAQALARPAYKEAIAHLERAARLCLSFGEDAAWRKRELLTELQLARALTAHQGWSAPATAKAYSRALKLADQVGDIALQLSAAYGRWGGYILAGLDSRTLAEEFFTRAERQASVASRLAGLRVLGVQRCYEGRFRESVSLMREVIRLYDPSVHADLARSFAADHRVVAAIHEAWALWHLGMPDQAERVCDTVEDWISEIDDSNTVGFALSYIACTKLWLRHSDEARGLAGKLILYAEDRSLAFWHAMGLVVPGLVVESKRIRCRHQRDRGRLGRRAPVGYKTDGCARVANGRRSILKGWSASASGLLCQCRCFGDHPRRRVYLCRRGIQGARLCRLASECCGSGRRNRGSAKSTRNCT